MKNIFNPHQKKLNYTKIFARTCKRDRKINPSKKFDPTQKSFDSNKNIDPQNISDPRYSCKNADSRKEHFDTRNPLNPRENSTHTTRGPT